MIIRRKMCIRDRYKDVEIHQQELCVLNDVNLELHKGEFVYLIGKDVYKRQGVYKIHIDSYGEIKEAKTPRSCGIPQ